MPASDPGGPEGRVRGLLSTNVAKFAAMACLESPWHTVSAPECRP